MSAISTATACVVLPALTLQIAHRRQTLTSETPGVVCEGVFVTWPNRAAKRAGIRPGMRLAQARTLVPGLQTATISDAEEQQAMQELWQCLLHFSPAIEIDAAHAGVLWLDPNGLQHLFGTHAQWGEAVVDFLRGKNYHARMVVGFNRYLALALAGRQSGCFVCRDAAHEADEARAMPLASVPLPADVRDALLLLGVRTLGDFLRMPVDEVHQCLGEDAEHIHRLAHNKVWTKLAAQKQVAPHEACLALEPPDADAHRLLFMIKSLLQPLLPAMRRGCEACVGVHLQLELEGKQVLFEHIALAQPTLDERKLTELLRLRLANLVLPRPVAGIILRMESRVVRPEQLMMLQQKPKRDVRAATWALAKIRALMGEGAVTHASLCDSHLPETSFRWELLHDVVLPQMSDVGNVADAAFPMVRAVRRVLLPPPPKRNMQAWLRQDGGIVSMHGPYRLQSAWWHRATERDYYYIQTEHEKLIWVYYSRLDNRWFRQGHVD